ncbi:MAG: hypothetical protein KTR27_01165 [Leptolyngbyaceae cyanobacterium MAG.088]|nr:hypothetical protein [Leptolyngbyaceae cyanobacterium MAG.088]
MHPAVCYTKRWEGLFKTLEHQQLEVNPEFIESIQTFRLGEQSEGRCLLYLAQQYANVHAEIIAVAYYGCLAKASENPVVQTLFEYILQDESMHLKFHGEHLRKLRGQGRWSNLRSGMTRLFVWQ